MYGPQRVEVIRNDALKTDAPAPGMAELETRWRRAIDRFGEENGLWRATEQNAPLQ